MGPAEIEIPDVVGLPALDAGEILTRAGLSPYGPDGGPAPTSGTVSAQYPAPTALAATGTAVVLHTDTAGPFQEVPSPPPEEPEHIPE